MTKLTEKEASGMTVNERLFVAGLMDAFDEAVAKKNESELRAILAQVFLNAADIDGVVRYVLHP
jgi:hypothetical protein